MICKRLHYYFFLVVALSAASTVQGQEADDLVDADLYYGRMLQVSNTTEPESSEETIAFGATDCMRDENGDTFTCTSSQTFEARPADDPEADAELTRYDTTTVCPFTEDIGVDIFAGGDSCTCEVVLNTTVTEDDGSETYNVRTCKCGVCAEDAVADYSLDCSETDEIVTFSCRALGCDGTCVAPVEPPIQPDEPGVSGSEIPMEQQPTASPTETPTTSSAGASVRFGVVALIGMLAAFL